MKGFKLVDNECIEEKPKECTELIENDYINQSHEEIAFGYLRVPKGCATCSNGYYPLSNFNTLMTTLGLDQFKKVCTVRTPATTLEDPQIANCAATKYKYNLNLEHQTPPAQLALECVECDNNWILTEDGKCNSLANNPNC